jgi:hypothetical protein
MFFSSEICILHLLFSVVFWFFLFLLYGTHVATIGYVVLPQQFPVHQTFTSYTFSPSRPSAICSVIMFHCPNPDCLCNVKKSRKPAICEYPRLVCSFDVVSRVQSLCFAIICQQHLHPACFRKNASVE